jgi:hypothetical protein
MTRITVDQIELAIREMEGYLGIIAASDGPPARLALR